jgi:tetratricopeptide (TPR) repeat protein
MAPSRTLLIGPVLATAALPAAGAGPETGWREVRTPHVVVQTDLVSADARRAALAVERTRAAMLATAWGGARLSQPEHIEVVVFSDGLDFEHHFGRNVGGVFAHGGYPPRAVLYGPPERWERRATLALEESTSVLRHELAHHLAAYVYRRQPRWFSEGLAQFLETIRVSEDGRSALLGAINPDALRSYNAYRTLTVADALAWGGKLDARDEGATAGLYGLSWLIVHWLYNVHPKELGTFQSLLARGIDPDKAWKVAFGSLALEGIDAELNTYARHGSYAEFTGAIAVPDSDAVERPLGSADVHAIRAGVALIAARMRTDAAPHRAEAEKELGLALGEDPGNVRALRLLGDRVPEGAARRAVAAHPDDGLAWLSLAESLHAAGDAAERERAYRRASELLPDHPGPFNALAIGLLRQDRPKEALPLASTAVQLAPWEPAFLETLATALAALGRCSEAAVTGARALDGLLEGASPAVVQQYRAHVDTLREKCRPGSEP